MVVRWEDADQGEEWRWPATSIATAQRERGSEEMACRTDGSTGRSDSSKEGGTAEGAGRRAAAR